MREQMPETEKELVQGAVRGLIVPLRRASLLIPNTVVAEVTTAKQYIPVSMIPEWVVAMFEWRGRSIPLVSFERLLGGGSSPTGEQTKTVILNTLNRDQALPFIGLIAQGVPRPFTVKDGMLDSIEKEGDGDNSAVLCHTTIRGEPAIIPDVDMLEKMILSAGILK